MPIGLQHQRWIPASATDLEPIRMIVPGHLAPLLRRGGCQPPTAGTMASATMPRSSFPAEVSFAGFSGYHDYQAEVGNDFDELAAEPHGRIRGVPPLLGDPPLIPVVLREGGAVAVRGDLAVVDAFTHCAGTTCRPFHRPPSR